MLTITWLRTAGTEFVMDVGVHANANVEPIRRTLVCRPEDAGSVISYFLTPGTVVADPDIDLLRGDSPASLGLGSRAREALLCFGRRGCRSNEQRRSR